MSKKNFYYGHSLDWVNIFRNTRKKNPHLDKKFLHLLVLCIHHGYRCAKQSTFTLNHKMLKQFDLDRRFIKPYLKVFQQTKLIKYKIKKGKLPIITLLRLPT